MGTALVPVSPVRIAPRSLHMEARRGKHGGWRVTYYTRDGRPCVGIGRTFMSASRLAQAIRDSGAPPLVDQWRGAA